ncbi:MAG: TlpA disulfide reductase family protein [Gammaproteobacteria bacterium]|jgi:thiol-disulfide isomerase/thioredoxin
MTPHTRHVTPGPRSGHPRRAALLKAALRGLAQITVLLFCGSLWAQAGAAEVRKDPDNTPAPPLELRDLHDETHTLADYHGKVLLVNFWASWCPPCIYEMPGLVRLQERLAERPFEVLAVNVGEKKYRVWKFVRLIDFDLPVLLDTASEAFEAWGVMVMPTSFLLDARGRIRYRISGDPGWDTAPTLAMLEELLAEAEQDMLRSSEKEP